MTKIKKNQRRVSAPTAKRVQKQPLVSVIVPTKNSQRTLQACLSSIKNQTYSSIELIVVDNNSVDHTQHIAKKHADILLKYGPERSAQRNAGAKVARGQLLFFIDSDMLLARDVVSEAVEICQTNPDIQAVVVPERSVGTSFWARCKSLERSLYLGVEWIESARFFRRSVFEKVGGYDERNTGTEDFDLPQRIKAEFGTESVARTSSEIDHDEGHLSLWYVLQKKFYYGQKLSEYISAPANRRYFLQQASPAHRFWLFLKNPKKLFKNPIISVGLFSMKSLEFIAGGLGYLRGSLQELTKPKKQSP